MSEPSNATIADVMDELGDQMMACMIVDLNRPLWNLSGMSDAERDTRTYDQILYDLREARQLTREMGPILGPGRKEKYAAERPLRIAENLRRNLKGHPCGRFVRVS
mgnify:CR=1 FL=1